MSKQVKSWLREYNQAVRQETGSEKAGVRIIPGWLPVKSPWLNCSEPKWVHSKRAIVEPALESAAQTQSVGTHLLLLQVKVELSHTKNYYNSLLGVSFKESLKEILITSVRNLRLLRTQR